MATTYSFPALKAILQDHTCKLLCIVLGKQIGNQQHYLVIDEQLHVRILFCNKIGHV